MMTGLVLCGGKSSRMGADKGLLKHEANTWAQTAVEKLQVLNIPVLLSVNELQYTEYAQVFEPEKLLTDDSMLDLKGPLLGLMSAHKKHPSSHFLVLACDMPLLETDTLKELYQYSALNPGFEVYVFTNADALEPLCAIYKTNGLQKIATLLLEQKLERHSMKHIIGLLKTYTIKLTDAQQKQFRNFNAHADLNGM